MNSDFSTADCCAGASEKASGADAGSTSEKSRRLEGTSFIAWWWDDSGTHGNGSCALHATGAVYRMPDPPILLLAPHSPCPSWSRSFSRVCKGDSRGIGG